VKQSKFEESFFLAHKSLPKGGIRRLCLNFGKIFGFEIFVAYKFLPHPFLIDDFEQPFAQEAIVFYFQNLDS
jgi:hypothetical protein